jgi:transcriptional repressor NrdR
MVCLYCGAGTDVLNTRPAKKSPAVWRRRRCDSCQAAFTSREKPDLSLSFYVAKQKGPNQPFSEDKLFLSVHRCLTHRKDALEASRALTETIIKLVLPAAGSGALFGPDISQAAYRVLSRFDKPAAVYYKAHHEFK